MVSMLSLNAAAPLLAAQTDGVPAVVWYLGLLITVFLLMGLLFAFIKSMVKRCSSNQVLVKYGMFVGTGQTAKTIHGGATYVLPFVQGFRYLSLDPIQIEIPLRGALSIENIRVNVPSVFTVAIGTEPELMNNASIRLLELTTDEIRKQAEEIIFGQLRQVVASMGIEDINRDRDAFLQHIQNSVEPELKKIGLVLINVNITDITDESGYIDAIGQKAAAQAIQSARADVADEQKRGEIRVADAEREREVEVANATKLREIGTREAQRIQAVRIAELLKEQNVGEQTAEFQRDVQVKDAEREKRIAIAEANATAVDGENIAEARIAKSQAELLVQRAEAYERGESRKREAEAAVIEIQNRAMAKAALADAERVEAEKRAEFEAVAKAEKARLIVQAEAEAERIRLEAQAQAGAVYAKLEAEARGQYEILAKKGEGLKQIVEACGGAREAFQLMMLEHLDNLAESSAKAISNIKFDKVVVWENGSGKNGRSNTADFLQGMTGTLPPMMQVLRDIGGIEMPDSLAKLVGVETKTDEGRKPAENGEAAPARNKG
ncbi:flotillin family protein [Botrimarina hoheduenensis]|uniref:Inner membrane protein YqiK n=1 Tax=Botrimarina hoheduenensis TaxID=2528000 RepID=A0A5C5WDA3_9BACT|nr:flotillin family protein [Botrimarina hoheduenensis]TWT47652.1 Inner membrane protein YqiK [Botrimarina hoheduenensis]